MNLIFNELIDSAFARIYDRGNFFEVTYGSVVFITGEQIEEGLLRYLNSKPLSEAPERVQFEVNKFLTKYAKFGRVMAA